MIISNQHIEYITRYNLIKETKIPSEKKQTFVPEINADQIMRIQGISLPWEETLEKAISFRLLMSDVISGLHSVKENIIFIITCRNSQVGIYMGKYMSPLESKNKESLCEISALKNILVSAYPGIVLNVQSKDKWQELTNFLDSLSQGLCVIGTPTLKVGDEKQGLEQLERLLRSFLYKDWAYIVSATPVSEENTVDLFNTTLNEMRLVQEFAASSGTQKPLSEKYLELLNSVLEKIELGRTQGLWHTSIKLFTQETDIIKMVKGLLKSIFGGEKSLPDPIIVLPVQENKNKFSLNLLPTDSQPGKFYYKYKYLSLLNSKELTAFIHLPGEERPGYYVSKNASFDVAGHQKETDNDIDLGTVIDRGTVLKNHYNIDLNQINKHGLIVGVTGSGKTNTIFHLVKQIWSKDIPFMVIEPAKTEYRKLINSELGKNLQVFTLGDDTISPFRLNPFEIMSGVSVQTHIDLLKSVFNASFILYAPMPYVLERCIHEIYEDKGWDLATNENKRGFHTNAQPTLTDLYRKIDPVVHRLGYEERITMDVKAALKTRINSLRIGGKGLMLDTKKSIPVDNLLQKPTVLELEQIGDDDEKAFIIGLLLTFLYEHYVSQGLREGIGVRHITVVEEAHRLFRNVPQIIDTEVANIKGKAVETFTNILSEIRAYGEGFLIAEQIPSKLALDIAKNTNLKVMHRIVAEDDRLIIGSTMNMTDDEERSITTLNVGEAAIYSEGDDTPILAKIPYSKIESKEINRAKENKIIHDSMKEFTEELTEVFVPLKGCSSYCKDICKYRKGAINIVENSEFQETLSRYILSVLARSESLIEEFPQLTQEINKLRKDRSSDSGVVLCTLLLGLDDYFETLGKIREWKYEDVSNLKNQLLSIVYKAGFAGQSSTLSNDDRKQVDSFKNKYLSLCKVSYYPFSGCRRICSDNLCLYRENVLQLTRDSRLHNNFINTLANYSGKEIWENLEKWCMVPVRRLITEHATAEEKIKIALCFTIQKAESMPYMDFFLREKIVTSIINLLNEKMT